MLPYRCSVSQSNIGAGHHPADFTEADCHPPLPALKAMMLPDTRRYLFALVYTPSFVVTRGPFRTVSHAVLAIPHAVRWSKLPMWSCLQQVSGVMWRHWQASFRIYTDAMYTVSQKNHPLCGLRFSDIFHKRLIILNQFLHTYYTLLLTLYCKYLFNYLQL